MLVLPQKKRDNEMKFTTRFGDYNGTYFDLDQSTMKKGGGVYDIRTSEYEKKNTL